MGRRRMGAIVCAISGRCLGGDALNTGMHACCLAKTERLERGLTRSHAGTRWCFAMRLIQHTSPRLAQPRRRRHLFHNTWAH